MRGISQETIIRRDVSEVWDHVSRLSFCRRFTESFFTGGRKLDYQVIRPEDALTRGPDDTLAVLYRGTQIKVATNKGKPWITWHVTEMTPPRAFALQASDTESWLGSYFAVIRLELSDLGEGKTRVNARLTLLFLNRALEVASLLLPAGLLYGWSLRRMCRRLRDDLSAA